MNLFLVNINEAAGTLIQQKNWSLFHLPTNSFQKTGSFFNLKGDKYKVKLSKDLQLIEIQCHWRKTGFNRKLVYRDYNAYLSVDWTTKFSTIALHIIYPQIFIVNSRDPIMNRTYQKLPLNKADVFVSLEDWGKICRWKTKVCFGKIWQCFTTAY